MLDESSYASSRAMNWDGNGDGRGDGLNPIDTPFEMGRYSLEVEASGEAVWEGPYPLVSSGTGGAWGRIGGQTAWIGGFCRYDSIGPMGTSSSAVEKGRRNRRRGGRLRPISTVTTLHSNDDRFL